ncbi:MAG TPA: sigma-70 family RNA polymerase sigma factor [Polyangiaceae bacterium LLY-WYZ-15_(1-7)]|nr:sigma-70 family RNA polymerase sigma factor [Polyangiaceae bacterium LLY-WYZ-15_(1-7)]HJL05767.1 sigma-70 family RNA polymerase sigma factor [Polyangiaceae bacterium LLY-WYZ-15_(1-7)]HJL11624.1 sigma-70 family RNA polymerase sigma factor [Polyangiaceae bacterium LLY-WYZ-15_(1-7)]HJL31810.1 sigma-70 family RNA polymerase sigma factor [Polyangiaceae bacterium LLY-WYZ-15_(1-7)]HJL38574.1 sigma-70 family RNA polymerase sigma factor [Polyangiaceae bacterium LLY-WYZ-15_(1-7)]
MSGSGSAAAPAGRPAEVVELRPGKVSPEALLTALREGHPRAPALLYDAFADDVNRLVWSLLGADPDHDDLVQVAMLKVLRKAKDVREPGALKGWVRMVTINVVRGELRKRKLRRALFVGGDAVDPDRFEAASADPERQRLLRATYAALEKLPADERIAFTLRVVEEHTLPEVAELCGCSLATAKRRVARARSKFEKIARRDPALRARVAGEGGGLR